MSDIPKHQFESIAQFIQGIPPVTDQDRYAQLVQPASTMMSKITDLWGISELTIEQDVVSVTKWMIRKRPTSVDWTGYRQALVDWDQGNGSYFFGTLGQSTKILAGGDEFCSAGLYRVIQPELAYVPWVYVDTRFRHIPDLDLGTAQVYYMFLHSIVNGIGSMLYDTSTELKFNSALQFHKKVGSKPKVRKLRGYYTGEVGNAAAIFFERPSNPRIFRKIERFIDRHSRPS